MSGARAPSTGSIPSAHVLERDDEAWDRFVERSTAPSYLQLTPWAAVKRPNGWTAVRLAAAAPTATVAAQLLVRRLPGLPWGLAYAPRGPLSAAFDREGIAAFTDRLREQGRVLRVASVRIDPEIDEGSPVAGWLAGCGWVRGASIQPDASRLIDLAGSEEALWDGMHRKCRQSVNKARRAGVEVVEGSADRLADFYRIHAEASRRAGIVPRAERTYRDIWAAFAPRGLGRLLFAHGPDGEAVGTLFLVGCDGRVVDLYGGTTAAGAGLRANYVLKWEALRRCREAGFLVYDLWGMPHAGISQFKAMFGGREVRYIGGWELPIDGVGRAALQAAQALRAAYVRWRHPRRAAGGGQDD